MVNGPLKDRMRSCLQNGLLLRETRNSVNSAGFMGRFIKALLLMEAASVTSGVNLLGSSKSPAPQDKAEPLRRREDQCWTFSVVMANTASGSCLPLLWCLP